MTLIDIFKIYQALSSEVNVQQGGQIRPVEDFERWYNAVSLELFREKVAIATLNQQNDDDLSPFRVSVNIVVQQIAGQRFGRIAYPADYEAFSDLRMLRSKDENKCGCDTTLPIIDGSGKCLKVIDEDYAAMAAKYAATNLIETTVNKVDNSRWGSCLEHATKGPTFDKPKATQYKDGISIAPAGLSVVVLDYYRTPRSAVFAYTIGAGDIIIYDAANSIQLEWSAGLTNEFLTRLRKKYGVHVGDEKNYQMADNDKKEVSK